MDYRIALEGHEDVANGTSAFHFTKPEGLAFKAGQYLDLTLIDPPETDAEGPKRSFSITSAPHEPRLTFTMRMRDTAFKRVLKSMAAGTEVKAAGPLGSFTLHNDATRPAAFLAGGIGVTPFVSIIRDAAERKLPHKIYLFYSNRRPEDSAYLAELKSGAERNPNYVFYGTMTEMEESEMPWDGPTGFLTKDALAATLPSLTGPIYYVAGPPGMVAAMRTLLEGAGVNGDDIRTEEFSGY